MILDKRKDRQKKDEDVKGLEKWMKRYKDILKEIEEKIRKWF